MAAKSKFFKAGTAGNTADGRVIEEQWLIDIHETYDRSEREASIFLDHIRYYGNYGTVVATKLEKDKKGRLTLYVQTEPTPNLMALNADKQYMYPSLGVIPNFAKTEKAYLGHLGAVQDPASVGVETAKYSNDDGSEEGIIYFALDEAITFELEPETSSEETPVWFKKYIPNFSNKDTDMDKKQALKFETQIASILATLNEFKVKLNIEPESNKPGDDDLAAKFEKLKNDFESFKSGSGDGEDSENQKQFKELTDQVEKLSTDLATALKESGSTDTPDHSGGSDSAFSVV